MDNNSDAPLKVTINGQEYDANEASELLDTGRKTREYEQKYNTSLDKVWPEYTRVAQERKQLADELADAKVQLTEFQNKKSEGSETPQDVLEAKEAARKLGLSLNEDLETNYVKKDTLDKYLEEREAKRDQAKQASDQVMSRAKELEQEINGSDGRPKFNTKAVLAYAATYSFPTLEEAYEDMHPEVKDWKQKQIDAQRSKSLRTMGAGGDKNPTSPRINRDNFSKMLSESMSGGQE